MKKTEQGQLPEETVNLLKEAFSAAEQLAKIKKLRSTVGQRINNQDKSVTEALKNLLKQQSKS
ncbi:hypothetical protein P378_12475 [Desulforamulus profundi]|uniref:Uncharacterized protein n=1 Tax=Desulforamulus profundi TaxID=1383067 RepID=A0A2C6MA04_9FIRM|nr:hypothetical protein [Desulforamulus profundi]PHJ37999.1 hypothetical protein P378_12475 [Desulforamulus profundi]